MTSPHPTADRDVPSDVPPDARSVLDYWFGEPGGPEHGTQRDMWFRKSDATDQEIAQRFGPMVERALRGREHEAVPRVVDRPAVEAVAQARSWFNRPSRPAK